jgi:hypothetical protein
LKLELRIVDRGETGWGGLLALRDVYLRKGGQTLLQALGVPPNAVEEIAAAIPDAALRFEKFTGHPEPGADDGTRSEVGGPAGAGGSDPHAPEFGEPVG